MNGKMLKFTASFEGTAVVAMTVAGLVLWFSVLQDANVVSPFVFFAGCAVAIWWNGNGNGNGNGNIIEDSIAHGRVAAFTTFVVFATFVASFFGVPWFVVAAVNSLAAGLFAVSGVTRWVWERETTRDGHVFSSSEKNAEDSLSSVPPGWNSF